MSPETQSAQTDIPVVTRLRWASSVTTWIDGYNLTVVSGLLFAIRESLHTTTFQGTLLIAAVLIGSLIGGLVTGVLADRIGRRTVFAYDLVFFVVFAALSAVAPTYGSLLVARLMLGLAIGADYAISPSFLAEMSPTRRRGWDLAFLWVQWTVGAMMSTALTALALGFLPPGTTWRVILAIPVIPAVIGLILRQSVPESPRWLAATGRMPEVGEVVDRYQLEHFGEAATPPLSRGEAARRWAYALGPWFFLAFMGYGVGLLLPYILRLEGASSASAALWWSTGVLAIGVVGNALGMHLVDRMGRKPLQTWGFALTALALAGLGILERVGAASYLAVVLLFALANFVYQGGPSISTGVYPAELFPTRRRSTVLGVATAVSRLGAAIGVVLLGGALNDGGAVAQVVFLGALAGVCGVAMTMLFGMETRLRTLEEIVTERAGAEMDAEV